MLYKISQGVRIRLKKKEREERNQIRHQTAAVRVDEDDSHQAPGGHH
jgi:hypothetical protein